MVIEIMIAIINEGFLKFISFNIPFQNKNILENPIIDNLPENSGLGLIDLNCTVFKSFYLAAN